MQWQIKCIFLTVLFMFRMESTAQEKEPTGKIRVVSLVNKGEGRTWVTLDEELLSLRGYKTGGKSGLFGLKMKSYELEAKREGCEPLKLAIQPNAKKNQILLFHPTEILDEEGEHEGWKIDHVMHEVVADSSASAVTLISFLPASELKLTLDKGKKDGFVDLTLLEKDPHTVSVSSAGRWITLSHNKNVLSSFHLEKPTEMLIVLYQDDDGEVRVKYFSGR